MATHRRLNSTLGDVVVLERNPDAKLDPWQESSTAHTTVGEAEARPSQMMELAEEMLAILAVVIEKTEYQRFSGSATTDAIDALMQHELGAGKGAPATF